MKHLLDVNVLIAGIVQTHSLHAQARRWLSGKQIVLCPLVELGFLRISTNKKSAIGLTMERAREALERFAEERKAERIPDDLQALESHPRTSEQVTDHYLANLAAKHGLGLATFDKKLRHPSAEQVC
jgi:toxin-antitoxin system PIN domain toxin